MSKHKGVETTELQYGTGDQAIKGSLVEIRYAGYLNRGGRFQENVRSQFRVGGRTVIAGLEYGVEGMHVGGRRKVRVSPHLAYGAAGIPGLIPPHAMLTFEIELLSVEDGGQ